MSELSSGMRQLSLGREVKKECPTCAYRWLDKYGKDECPKCLNPLSTASKNLARRQPGEAVTNKPKPSEAFESESGSCPNGGTHSWKFGKCLKCHAAEGYERHDYESPASAEKPKKKAVEKKRTCPTCEYSWMDRYRKNECPKCLNPIKFAKEPEQPKASEAFESQSGSCPSGGSHAWKFGKCGKCGVGEGYERHSTREMVRQNSSMKEKRRTCPVCDFNWLDRYNKNECPKCISPILPERSASRQFSRRHSIQTDQPNKEVRRSCQVCSYSWLDLHRLNVCPKCSSTLMEEANSRSPKPNYQLAHMSATNMSAKKEIPMQCPTCEFKWLDRYRKGECPKCLMPLGGKEGRAPGEVSTHKHKPSDAMQSASGSCREGGLHTWKFGRCSKCGVGEGYRNYRASAH